MADPESGTSEGKKEHEIYESRLEKARKWRELGFNPWGNGYRPEHLAGDVIKAHGEQTTEQLEAAAGPAYHVAGRVIALRSFGKAAFLKLRDRSGEIQVHLKKDVLGDSYELFRLTDLGDVVAVIGTPFRSKSGELTLAATKFVPLTKSLRALPEKWHGLVDVETRYRQRYLDLISNPEVKEVFRKRIELIRFTREFFDARDFLEVETPMMHPLVSGANARPFITHHNALDIDLYLRIAPELYLKRLVVGGLDRVYEINRNFRNEGISTRHNPEFTMLEFYQAYATYEDLMQLTEEFFAGAAQRILGTTRLTYQGVSIDLQRGWQRIPMIEAIRQALPRISERDISDVEKLRAEVSQFAASERDRAAVGQMDQGQLLAALFEQYVEEKLVGPVFITAFPTSISPLARRNDAHPEIADRFELFIAGRELANGFSELNDPLDQKERFLAQLEAKKRGRLETMDYDDDYIRALEHGMPPTAGEGLGIDRVAMLFADQPSIRDVILFPLLKPPAR
jgi:lysyl-tRNA synthetase class 2